MIKENKKTNKSKKTNKNKNKKTNKNLEIVHLVARILLGLIFFLFGLNGILAAFFDAGILKFPPSQDPFTIQFNEVFMGSFIFPTVKIVETVCGILLLGGFAVRLALVMLAPIVVSIFLFHITLDPGGLAMTVVILVAYFVMLKSHCKVFQETLLK